MTNEQTKHMHAVDPARLRTLLRTAGAWLEIRVGAEVIGTVRSDLVRALLKVKGASWAYDDERRALSCSWVGPSRALGGGAYTTPGGSYVLYIAPPGHKAKRRATPVASPDHYTPAERAEYAAAPYSSKRDAIAARIKGEQRAAAVLRKRMERVETWDDEAGAWSGDLEDAARRDELAHP